MSAGRSSPNEATSLAGVGVYCEATFNYAGDEELVAVVQPVRDARAAEGLRFEECGFARMDSPSEVTDWTDPEHVDAVHGPEFRAFALGFTGADEALVYPCIIRSPTMASVVGDYAPSQAVHSDFTEDFGSMVTDPGRPYRDFFQPILEANGLTYDDIASAERLLMLQTWRNVGPVEADHPLAYCDASSVSVSRLERVVVPEYGGRRLELEAFVARRPGAGDADHWYTYPQLHDDEVVVLRTYDSQRAERGLPFWTLHAAFRDPKVPDGGAHRRESVEMRALCLWR